MADALKADPDFRSRSELAAKAEADLHRDEWGPVGRPEWLHFIEADGSLRAGHEAFNEFAPQQSTP